jgi:hypothetical protein
MTGVLGSRKRPIVLDEDTDEKGSMTGTQQEPINISDDEDDTSQVRYLALLLSELALIKLLNTQRASPVETNMELNSEQDQERARAIKKAMRGQAWFGRHKVEVDGPWTVYDIETKEDYERFLISTDPVLVRNSDKRQRELDLLNERFININLDLQMNGARCSNRLDKEFGTIEER